MDNGAGHVHLANYSVGVLFFNMPIERYSVWVVKFLITGEKQHLWGRKSVPCFEVSIFL